MTKTFQLTALVITACFAIMMIANMLFHFILYAVTGEMEKVFSWWWISIELLTLVSGLIAWRLFKGMSS